MLSENSILKRGTRNMKKILAFGAAVLTLLTTALPAFAADVSMHLSFQLEAEGSELRPDREYRFPILVQYEDEVPSHLREEEMDGRRLTVTVRQGGEAIYTPTVETQGGRYYLVVKTKPYYSTRAAEAELLVRLRNGGGGELSQSTLLLSVGSSRMPDETLERVDAGETVPVDNRFPVITKKQLQRLAELNNYRTVTLEGDGWEYTVKLSDLGDLNLYSTSAVSQEVLRKYPDREFYFLSFPASPDFGVAGTMTLDVEALTEFDGEFYLYRRLGDRLYYLKTQYDEEAETLTFRPSQLGDYLITDGKLGDVELGSGAVLGATAGDIATPNPDTGSRQTTGPVALLGLSALGIGLLVAFRKG